MRGESTLHRQCNFLMPKPSIKQLVDSFSSLSSRLLLFDTLMVIKYLGNEDLGYGYMVVMVFVVTVHSLPLVWVGG